MEQAVAVIFWLGQACFVIQAGDTTILTDPFNERMGYEVTRVEGVDLVIVSHEHGDHNTVGLAAGKPQVLRGLTEKGAQFNRVDQKIKNVRLYTVNAYHDEAEGAKRGKNAIFVIEILSSDPPVRIVHMGDFGEKRVGSERVKAIGPIDILLLPVGGFYTIGAEEANGVVAELKPKIVVPMHYKTAKTPQLPVKEVAPFLEGKKHVLRDGPVSQNRLTVTASLLRKAQEAGEPLIAALQFGPPPPMPAKSR